MYLARLARCLHYFVAPEAIHPRRGVNFALGPWENTMMKYAAVALTLAAALVLPAAAHANPNDVVCKITNNKAKGCEPTTVPEPGDLMLLSTGLAGLGAFSFLRRHGKSKQL
jgi:hypothetical protein